MDSLIEVFRSQAAQIRRAAAQPRIGLVTSCDNMTSSAKVLFQPEGVLSGWLPILSPWCGSEWGMSCPLSPGDQVVIIPQEGSSAAGIIIGCLYSSSRRPPQVDIGEFTLTHQSGVSLSLSNSGAVLIKGDLHVSGNIYDAQGPLSRLRGNYDSHVHHTNNGGVTSPPTPQD